MTGSADVLVVMARYPTAGEVKTRLAKAIGADRAAALYRAFLQDLSAGLRSGPWALVWAVTPPAADLQSIIGTGAVQIPQDGADLAARMHGCFVRLFADGARRVVMIGADAPHLDAAVVAAAFAALADHDAVFVPARDGGYCLVGLGAAHDIFSGVAMGTAAVFAQTRERLADLGLRWRALDETFDVDELADLRELSRLIASGAVELPHTAAVLRQIA